LDKLARLHRAALAEFNHVRPILNTLRKVEIAAQGAEEKYRAVKIRIPASSKR
jgi:hypothetical protein